MTGVQRTRKVVIWEREFPLPHLLLTSPTQAYFALTSASYDCQGQVPQKMVKFNPGSRQDLGIEIFLSENM